MSKLRNFVHYFNFSLICKYHIKFLTVNLPFLIHLKKKGLPYSIFEDIFLLVDFENI